MDIYDFLGLVTGVLMALFIGIVLWAYSSRRKSDFEEAARLPFGEDGPADSQRHKGEVHSE